jgi:hypothetical protein
LPASTPFAVARPFATCGNHALARLQVCIQICIRLFLSATEEISTFIVLPTRPA